MLFAGTPNDVAISTKPIPSRCPASNSNTPIPRSKLGTLKSRCPSPFADATFDAVTSGYLLRNVADRAGAFREQARVVRPGGYVVCLDTSPPPPSPLRPLVLFHLRRIIPLLGRLIAGERSAYAYLSASTEGFKAPEELATIMREAGLLGVRYRRFMAGTIAVHVGMRPAG